MKTTNKRCGALAAAALACVVCACGVEEGRFPPPTMNALAPAPSWLNLPYEDVTLTTSQGRPVHAWYIPADDAVATVLISHGAISNRSSTFLHYEMFHHLGCNVLVYDYQGFGENYNTPSLDTILPDAEAALLHLQQRTEPGSDRIVLFGLSLGTLPSIALAAAEPDRVVGVIVEGSFTMESLPSWSLLLTGIVPWTNALDEMQPELRTLGHAGDVTLPILFLHSREDYVTPFEGAEQIYELVPGRKQLIEILGPHTTGLHIDPNYAEYIRAFLESLD